MKEIEDVNSVGVVAKIDYDGVSKITLEKTFLKEQTDTFFKSTSETKYKTAIMKKMFDHGEYVFKDKSVYVRKDNEIYIIMMIGSQIDWGTVVRIKKKTITMHQI